MTKKYRRNDKKEVHWGGALYSSVYNTERLGRILPFSRETFFTGKYYFKAKLLTDLGHSQQIFQQFKGKKKDGSTCFMLAFHEKFTFSVCFERSCRMWDCGGKFRADTFFQRKNVNHSCQIDKDCQKEKKKSSKEWVHVNAQLSYLGWWKMSSIIFRK